MSGRVGVFGVLGSLGVGRAFRAACAAALVGTLAGPVGCGPGGDGDGDGDTEDGTSTDGTGGSEGTNGTNGSGGSDVPANAYCEPAADWDPGWTALEAEVVALVNQRRAAGANCGGAQMPATGPLTAVPALRCAARVHNKDMVDNNYFDHVNLMGEDPGDRIDKTGYQWWTYGENIAGGNSTAEAVVQQWMDSPGHCSNIMAGDFEEIGVGYTPGGQWGHTWTQVFGTPQ